MSPLNLSSFPRAILHIDGDCFFASCEIARDPALKGRPVVTGLERGIASSMSYEAKRRGVARGMSLGEIKKVCPEAVVLPSDYETYSLYSVRMFSVVKRYTEAVEEYSIDECYADLTGMRRPLGMSYEKIVHKIKKELDQELGMTFSVGLAPSKVLAKVGSKWKKPSGLTLIPGRSIHLFLARLDLDGVWGIGPQTSAFLRQYGMRTALDFTKQDKEWVREKMTKPHYEIWQELRGKSVYEVKPGEKREYKSVSKTKTFTPPSRDRDYVFAQLSKNAENACIKLRRYGLAASKIVFFLKTQDFRFQGLELKLSGRASSPVEFLQVINEHFDHVFDHQQLYRSTGVVLTGLEPAGKTQLDLFGQALKAEKLNRIFGSADELARKYGKHTLFLGSSLQAMASGHKGERGESAERKTSLFRGEGKRKRLGIPMLGEVG